jgi:hypothetical protein
MSERANELTADFKDAVQAVTNFVEGCDDASWAAVCTGENWSVGVTPHHIAGGIGPIGNIAKAVAHQGPVPPITPEMLDQSNAQHAQDYANVTQIEVLELLRAASPHVAEMVRGLTEEQLASSAQLFGGSFIADQVITQVLIGHIRTHLESMVAAADS